MPQLRQSVITGDWVIIAPERAKRPDEYHRPKDAEKPAPEKACVFCPNSEAYQKIRLKQYESELIYVIPNKFPAYIDDGKDQSYPSYIEEAFYRAKVADGGHDVIVIKDHDKGLLELDQQTLTELFTMIQKRYRYYADQGVEYPMAIYNHGPESGASIVHPHAQIFASPMIPNIIAKELDTTQAYFDLNGTCAFCDLIGHEMKQGIRMIGENQDFVAFTFYAARYPFEAWVMPKIHNSRFDDEPSGKIESLSNILHDVFGKYNKLLKDPPLNFFIHSIPNSTTTADYYHWHLEIAPRITSYGGYEMGSGVIIDVMNPEDAATYLMGGEPAPIEPKEN